MTAERGTLTLSPTPSLRLRSKRPKEAKKSGSLTSPNPAKVELMTSNASTFISEAMRGSTGATLT